MQTIWVKYHKITMTNTVEIKHAPYDCRAKEYIKHKDGTVAIELFYNRGGSPTDGEYPGDWPEIAKQVKDAAGWRCIRCGHPNESPKERIPCDDKCDLSRHIEVASVVAMLDGCDDIDINAYRHNGIWPAQRQRVLTVHHLDGDKHNCAWWNLTALCQVCHLQIQAKVNMAQIYPLEHSSWFKPYAAGYYAQIYLNLPMNRKEVMENLNALLALEKQL